MGRYKFLILTIPTEYLVDELESTEHKPIIDQIQCQSDDDPEMRFIECPHPLIADNIVEFTWHEQTYEWDNNLGARKSTGVYFDREESFIRDCDGSLWAFSDILSKDDLIREMEVKNAN